MAGGRTPRVVLYTDSTQNFKDVGVRDLYRIADAESGESEAQHTRARHLFVVELLVIVNVDRPLPRAAVSFSC
jgi:hypothetical protein